MPWSTTRNNVATYTIAPLALPDRATPEHSKTHVTTNELAQAFFHAYRQRLANGLPPPPAPARKTVLERGVVAYQRDELDETAAVEKGEREGFSDVVPRFHTVNGDPIPLRFYETTLSGLVLTDALLAIFHGSLREALRAEAESRWDVLEAAFAMHLPVEVLGTDEHRLYRTTGYERIDITGTHPVLYGYQNGLCFSCKEPLVGEQAHVDHVIPRTFLNHDEIWNLVLAPSRCNLERNTRLPSRLYLNELYERNAYYIASNHPIKPHLIAQGNSSIQRQALLERIFHEAEKVLILVWEGKKKAESSNNPLAPPGLIVPT